MVASPITGNSSTLVHTIPVQRIIDDYKDLYNISIERHFDGMNNVEVYKCPDTGYRFFYPYSVIGDEQLYDDLQQYDWYYPEWKWEYNEAPKYIDKGSKVLEVGCGEGNFLKYITKELDCDVTGIELNAQAVEKGRAAGLNMHQELVQDHAINHAGVYDVVCFFQVLEHIADIKAFLDACVKCVRPGGRVLIAVPNNDPYFHKVIKDYALNIPPHHMGWWNTESLTKIAPYFGLEADKVYYDNISTANIPTLTNIYISEKAYKKPLKRQLMRLMKPVYWAWFLLTKNTIPDNHILAVYTKK